MPKSTRSKPSKRSRLSKQKPLPPGLSLRIDRLRCGLRQFDLAAKANLNPSKLSLIETGRIQPSDDELARIRKALADVQGQDPLCPTKHGLASHVELLQQTRTQPVPLRDLGSPRNPKIGLGAGLFGACSWPSPLFAGNYTRRSSETQVLSGW